MCGCNSNISGKSHCSGCGGTCGKSMAGGNTYDPNAAYLPNYGMKSHASGEEFRDAQAEYEASLATAASEPKLSTGEKILRWFQPTESGTSAAESAVKSTTGINEIIKGWFSGDTASAGTTGSGSGSGGGGNDEGSGAFYWIVGGVIVLCIGGLVWYFVRKK